MFVTSSAPPRPKTGVRRSRAITSCHACRAHRTKCDRNHPVCGRCSKKDAVCIWAGNTSKFSSAAQRAHRRHSPEHDGAGGNQLQDDILMETRSGDPATLAFDHDLNVESAEGYSQGLRPGYLALQSGGRSRYVHNNFWANVGNKDMELDELLSKVTIFPFPNSCCSLVPCEQFCSPPTTDSENASNAPSKGAAKMTCSNVGSCCNRIYSLSQLLDTLPPKDTCDELYQTFLDNIHPIAPLLHLPTFEAQYIRFWHWFLSWDRHKIPSGVLAETPSFLPLLFAVCFAGSFGPNTIPSSQDSEDGSFSAITTSLYKSHYHALSLVSFPQSPTIYSLIAYLIAQNLLIREESLSSCSFVSVALRIAQAMGLNRDGTYFKLDPIQAEIRRRVWWHIIHTDVMTSFPSGLPPLMVVDNHYDTRMISELKDEYIGSSTNDASESGELQDTKVGGLQNTVPGINTDCRDDQTVDIRHVVSIGRYQITTLMRKILRHQFNVLPMSGADIMALKAAVDEQSTETAMRIKQIASIQVYSMGSSQQELDPNPSPGKQSNTMTAVAFQGWAQKLLRLLSHKAYCMLYQPLLKGVYGGLKSRIRKDAIHHCHAYVETFLDMCTTPEFRPFYWLYPGTYQPLQATAILLDDVLKSPFSAEAQHSRTLVERLFSFEGPYGVGLYKERGLNRDTSHAGKAVWEMLRRLRRRAWKKAGIDPDMAWLDGNIGHNIGAMDQNATLNPTPSHSNPAVVETSEQPGMAHACEGHANTAPTDTHPMADDFWTGSPDVYEDNPSLCGQFTLSDVDGLNWTEWDFLVDRYLNMPDPGQLNF